MQTQPNVAEKSIVGLVILSFVNEYLPNFDGNELTSILKECIQKSNNNCKFILTEFGKNDKVINMFSEYYSDLDFNETYSKYSLNVLDTIERYKMVKNKI